MKILIAGSRNITNISFVYKEICHSLIDLSYNSFPKNELGEPDITIISGGAKGVDSIAEKFAKDFGFKFKLFEADWDLYGKSAGYKRNEIMVKECDFAIIIWDTKSKGTKHTIDLLNETSKTYILIEKVDL